VRQKVDNRSSVGLGAADVLLASLGGDERPARGVSRGVFIAYQFGIDLQLLNVDCGGPLVVAEEMETPHANLSEVTGMV